MVIIAGMKMPENCQQCPFLYAGIAAACCVARARYEAEDGKWGVNAPRLWDGNDAQRDSDCPLFDDTAIDAALNEIRRLRDKLANYENRGV